MPLCPKISSFFPGNSTFVLCILRSSRVTVSWNISCHMNAEVKPPWVHMYIVHNFYRWISDIRMPDSNLLFALFMTICVLEGGWFGVGVGTVLYEVLLTMALKTKDIIVYFRIYIGAVMVCLHVIGYKY